MMKLLVRLSVVVAMVASLLAGPAQAASAATDTNTSGRITSYNYDRACYSDCALGVPGGSVFRGTTTPARAGHKVVFSYRRGPGHSWNRFEGGGCCGRADRFNAMNRAQRPYDFVDADGRWRMPFTPWDVCCRVHWQIRAKFLRQDGYRASQVVIPVHFTYFGD